MSSLIIYIYRMSNCSAVVAKQLTSNYGVQCIIYINENINFVSASLVDNATSITYLKGKLIFPFPYHQPQII